MRKNIKELKAKGPWKNQGSVGVDIGTHSIKVVELHDGKDGLCVSSFGYKEIPCVFNPKDAKMDSKLFTQALGELLQEKKIKAKRVKAVISDPSVYLRHISIPKVAEEELSKAIKWQAEKYAPFPVDSAIVDFQTLSSKEEGKTEIVIVAAQETTINEYINLFKNLRLTPHVLDLSCFAIAKLFLHDLFVKKDETIAVVDIGGSSTSVIIIKEGALEFVRKLELGGSHFTQAIIHKVNVEKSEVENIKRSSSIFPSGHEDKGDFSKVFPIFEPIVNDLVTQIGRSFAYCESKLFLGKINQLVLCGGGAKLKGLEKFLGEKFGLPVEIANPFERIALSPALGDKESLDGLSSELVAALGAAL